MKLVVAGGNGFIGSQICRIAIANGHEVVAFGRRGKPDITPVKAPWVGKVDWRTADIFDRSAWTDALDDADAFDADTVNTVLRDLADEHDVGAGKIIHPTRLAVSGLSYGPSLFDMMVVLGRETCIRRMHRAADVLG